MNINSINDVLSQMRAITIQAGSSSNNLAKVTTNNEFATVLSDRLQKINNTQVGLKEVKTAFDLGVPKAILTPAMVASQKASLSVQVTLQARNKMLQAYNDIMNMPI